jgi:hypothetical protein
VYNNNIMATTIIQVRRDTAANWTSNNPILATGELGFETDTGLFKIGRNDTAWTSLDYAQVAGPAGPVGEVGLTGAPGENGMNGAPGDNGLSAYEIWLNLGNSGSEQDFIDSLAGEDGLAGVNGEAGAAGAAGAPGPAGADGAPGADGQDGDPSDIQKLVFSYGASSPNTNSGNWTNNAGTPSVSGTLGFPDIYSQSFNIEKTSATSVIEISFDAVFDIAFNQNLGWGST